jgi:hypothetical protein
MAVRNVTMRNLLATAYGTNAPYGALFTGDPGTADAATNEVTGAAYARVANSWGAAASSAVVGVPVFTVPAGVTVTYAGVTLAGTKTTADVRDSAAVTSQAFASQGTYTVTFTFTVT